MSKRVEIEGARAIKETELALLCEIDGDEVWIPKSQIDEKDSEVLEEGDEGTVVVTNWWARQNGFA